MSGEHCPTCALITSLTEDATAYSDANWTVGIAVDVPGWLMLASNHHVEGAEGLDDQQAAAFGRLAARLARAVKDECGAERVYLMYQGEHSAHFHAMAVARGPEIPADWRGMALLGHHQDLADPAAAQRVVDGVRPRLAARS